jgi:hypothetical protein
MGGTSQPTLRHSTRCPQCGLELQVSVREGAPELGYDFVAWNGRCKFPLLGGPSMCLARASEPMAAVIDRPVDYRYDPTVEPLG